MNFQIRQAARKQARLRLALIGPSGSGKTLSSLLLAYGVVGDWRRIAVIDTEQGSGELYEGDTVAGVTIGRYQYGRITAPFTAQAYLDAIHACEAAVGPEGAVIIDSLSHAWSAEGGILDKVDRLTERGNKFAAWRHVTPDHNSLVEAMLQSPSHILACVRAKQEYVQEKDDTGKTVVRKVGLAPVQRDGMEYEFTTVLDLDMSHTAGASKDRTHVMDGRFVKPSVALGQAFKAWLDRGAPEAPRPTPPAAPSAPPPPPVDDAEDRAAAEYEAAQRAKANGATPEAPYQKGDITDAQIRAVCAVAKKAGLEPHVAAGEILRRPVAHLDALTKAEASAVIKGCQARLDAGGGR